MDVNTVFCVELYDTTTSEDILIVDELISRELAWPDLAEKQEEREGKYVKVKVSVCC